MVDHQTVEYGIELIKGGLYFLVWPGLPAYFGYKLIKAGEKLVNIKILNKKLSNPLYKAYLEERIGVSKEIMERTISEEGKISPSELRRTLDSIFNE